MKTKKELIMRKIAGDYILVPVGKTVLDNNGLFVLNEVSADIWKLLSEGKNTDEIVSALSEIYDADPAVIRADTDELIARLVETDLIEL